MLFNRGEDVKLLVRLSQPGYFYIVGHVIHEDEKFSYLIELNDAPGNDKFVSYVPPDYVNRYVELGEFEIDAPYGVEHLQLIASNKPIGDQVPGYRYDSSTGYYMISGSQQNAQSAVTTTRGLKSKISKSKKETMSHESVLTFTTMN